VNERLCAWSVLVKGFIRKWRVGRKRSLGSIGGGGMGKISIMVSKKQTNSVIDNSKNIQVITNTLYWV